jgi:nucleotide-binding universal stress UspA family protein
MKRILLAYDGSHFAESALGDLPRMGLDVDATICVLVVVPKAASAEAIAEAEKQSAHASQVILSLMPQVQTETEITTGAAADEILLQAQAQQTELIILGAHGKSMLERLLFGSVSSKVAAEAPCSVRLCRPHSEPGFQHLRLTLAIDGSAGSELAVTKTLQRAWPQGTGFHVISVVDPAHPSDSMQLRVSTVAAQLKEAGYYALPVLLEGNPAKAIIKHSETWAPHCILLGSHGREHGTARKLGTLATEMVHHGHSHVEVMR